ncbi:MAG: alpha/beta hydrolase, partial [Chloroflexaceae bacterium]|nr:alpha/beta hydrolase [Chloroflexaceae bacterium]
MKSHLLVIWFIGCLLLTLVHPVLLHAQESEPTADPMYEQRRHIAASKQFVHPVTAEASLAQAIASDSLATALDIPRELLIDTDIIGPRDASGVYHGLGDVIQPRTGDSFVLLSTGVAGTDQPEPGADYAPGNSVAGDRVTLNVRLALPSGTNQVSIDYNFLSAEYPEYVGTLFDDTFRITVQDSYGLREVTRASVNSANFMPVSAAQAAGSGFDLFSAESNEVDLHFGLGLPDAGLTGFQTAQFLLHGGGETIITFSIEDRGDGILDSAVILDGLVVSPLQMINLATSSFLTGDGQIIADPELLARGGDPARGVATDGVARLLIREMVPGPGTIEFCLDDATYPIGGGLALIDSPYYATCVTHEVYETSVGYLGLAVYRAPEGMSEYLSEQGAVTLRAQFTPAEADNSLDSPHTAAQVSQTRSSIRLMYPPILLIHGLWSDANTWQFPIAHNPKYSITRAQYDNVAGFGATKDTIKRYAEAALKTMEKQNICVEQITIVGHSMGGIKGLLYANEFPGRVDQLITLNTPHFGSRWANVILSVRHAFPEAIDLIEKLGNRSFVSGGAIKDLALGSLAINDLPSLPSTVPGHALVGEGGSEIIDIGRYLSQYPPLKASYTIFEFFNIDIDDIFGPEAHDLVVGASSQRGNLRDTTTMHWFDSIHTVVTESWAYSWKIEELLTGPSQSSATLQDSTPAEAQPMLNSNTLTTTFPITVNSVLTDSLIITLPTSPTSVIPGEDLQVLVEPQPGVSVDAVLVVGPGTAVIDDEAPFEIDLPIPEEVIGTFALAAIGKDSDHNFTLSPEMPITVLPQAPIESISILPREHFFTAIGETDSLLVAGQYSDNITRTITAADTGTIYLTSDPDIVIVLPDGTIRATGYG